MKKIIVSAVAFVSALSSVSFGAETTSSQGNISPFNLAALAYRGEFEAQGLKSYRAFCDLTTYGDVSAQDIADAAIEKGTLGAQYATADYVSALENQVTGFCNIH